MMRVLAWAVGCVGLGAGGYWLLARPQTWIVLSHVSAVVNALACTAYNLTMNWEKTRQEEDLPDEQRRQIARAVRQSEKPLPSGDVVIDAVEYFLRRRRRDA